MAEDLRMALLELLGKAELEDDVDFLREGVRLMAQQLMEAEVAQHVGANKYERTAASRRWLLSSAARATPPPLAGARGRGPGGIRQC